MEKLLERERELAAVAELLECGGGVLVIEGGVGIGKTSLVEAGCRRAAGLGHEVLLARGSALEADFAFGVVRQLFERRLAGSGVDEREALLAGPAGAARPLLLGELLGPVADDTSFAVLHGLYWVDGYRRLRPTAGDSLVMKGFPVRIRGRALQKAAN